MSRETLELTAKLSVLQMKFMQPAFLVKIADGCGLVFDELGGIYSLNQYGERRFTDRNIYIICRAAGIDEKNITDTDGEILWRIFRMIDHEAQIIRMNKALARSSNSPCYGHHWAYSNHREGILRFPNSHTNENF